MSNYLNMANSLPLYLTVAGILGFVALECIVFMVKSYKAGTSIGMDKTVLKKTIISSAIFTSIPAISILLGVIALSGSLGIPTSWLRLSVVGNLTYETLAAGTAAQAMGTTLDPEVLTGDNLVTILLVMSVGICLGCVCSIFLLKTYTKKLSKKSGIEKKSTGKTFADWALIAMFIGMCSSFIGSYIAMFLTGIIKGTSSKATFIPLLTALVAAFVMTIFEYLTKKKGFKRLEDFSLAASMLVAMAAACIASAI